MTDAYQIGQTIYEQALMLDTGPLISLYTPNDPQKNEIQELLQQIESQSYPVCITHLTIAETHRRILYDNHQVVAIIFLRNIYDRTINIFELQHPDIHDAIGIIARYSDQQISYTDAINMAVMKRVGIRKVLTYDHHFQILNFSIMP